MIGVLFLFLFRYVAKYENSFEAEETDLVRIDGLKIGNEMRYINDSRNTGKDVNVQFILAWIGEKKKKERKKQASCVCLFFFFFSFFFVTR